MNRYRNTIRFLVEAGCEVLIVTPGKVHRACSTRTAQFTQTPPAAPRPRPRLGACPNHPSLGGSPTRAPAPLALRPATTQGVTLPGADFSAGVDQPEEFEGARIVSAFSFGCPWYWRLPLSFGLSPRIYKEIK
jgi:hypothetical protein